MNAIAIRRASEDDLSAMEQIERRCFAPVRRGSRRTLRRSLRSPFQSVWFIEQTVGVKCEVMGAMALYRYPRSIRIFSLAVLPPFRHKGIGRRLVLHAIDLARREGLARVTLEADQRSRRLVAWYETFGFEPRVSLRHYYCVGRHAVRMRLILEPKPKGGCLRGRS